MDAPILIPVAMMAGFIILGVILSMGKCSFLIAGYNMMSKEQKKLSLIHISEPTRP